MQGKGLVYEQCISGLWDSSEISGAVQDLYKSKAQFNNRNGMVKFDDTVGPQDGRISLYCFLGRGQRTDRIW